MVISHAFCNDNFRIFDFYKPIMTERLIVHTHGLHTCMFILMDYIHACLVIAFIILIVVRFIFQLLEYDIVNPLLFSD
jgi:hypothetical protein